MHKLTLMPEGFLQSTIVRIAFALLVAASAMAAQAQNTVPLTLENIFTEGRGVRQAALSPDGRRAAAVGAGPEGSGIYLVATNAESPPSIWAAGGNPSWAPGSDRIAFVKDGSIWTIDVGSSEPDQVRQQIERARDPVFSPDGRTIAYYSTASGSQDIWLVAADGSQPPRQLTRETMPEDDRRFEPSWAPDGQRIAVVSNRADFWSDDVWVVHVESGEMQRVSNDLMASSTPVWSPSGDQIALLGTAKDEYWYQDLAYVYVLEPDDGTERIVDMQVYATDFIMRNRPFWSGDGSQLFFPYHQRGSFNLWAAPADGGVATRFTNLGGMMTSFSASEGADAFVFVRSTPTEGSDLYHISKQGGPAQRLTQFAPAWENVSAPQEVAYRTFDGMYIQGFMYRPPNFDPSQQYPALVQVHGGGTNSYYQRLNLMEQYLAARGYVVLAINYRGGSGFGRPFQDLAVEDWLNHQALDAASAAEYLRGLPFVSGKVGIYGGSYGGSMTMAAISREPDAFDAAVAMRGAYSKTETFEQTDRLGQIFTKTGHGGLPDERPDTYAKSNTIDRIQNIETPVLLMHGEADRRVPFRHFELAVEQLEKYDKTFESHSYPGEGHGFNNPQNYVDMYGRLEAFFGKYLRRPE